MVTLVELLSDQKHDASGENKMIKNLRRAKELRILQPRKKLLIIGLIFVILNMTFAVPSCKSNDNGQASFGLSINPRSILVYSGESAECALVLTSFNLSTSIKLFVTSYPQGTSFVIDPNEIDLPINSSKVSMLTISTNSNAIPGNYSLTLLAESNKTVTYLNFQLKIIDSTPQIMSAHQTDIVKAMLTAALTLSSILVAVVGMLLSIYSKLRPATDETMLAFRRLIWMTFFVICLGISTSLLSFIYLLTSETLFVINFTRETLFYIVILLFVVTLPILLVSVFRAIKKIFETVV